MCHTGLLSTGCAESRWDGREPFVKGSLRRVSDVFISVPQGAFFSPTAQTVYPREPAVLQ